MSEDILPLGLEDKDRVANSLGGGIPRRSVVLIEGNSGTGKSIWCQRIAKGVCDEGKKVSYISGEESAFSFIDQMKSLSYDISQELLRQDLLFLRAETKTTDASGCLIYGMLESEEVWKSDLVIIDNFGRILKCDRENGYIDDERGFIENFEEEMASVRSEGKSIVLAVDSDIMSEDAIQLLRSFATVQIRLHSEVVGGDVSSYAEVKQYKNMKDRVDNVINYNIKSGRGLSVENRTIA